MPNQEANEGFEVIVVGGGLAGLAAAYTLADRGVEVLVLERGDYCGAKNVTGGRIYLNPIRDLFPQLWKDAPFERYIAHEEVSLFASTRSITLRYDGNELGEPPYQSYSVLRAKFDRWLARQVEQKGAMLVTKSRVDDVILENGAVKGVRAGGEELRANVVIACDGVLSLVSEKAGLRKDMRPQNYAVGIKEVIEMDRATIENRFNLEGEEGAARLFMGDVTAGMFGGGFLYTNLESISLGLVVSIEALSENQRELTAPELLERFKERPEVSCLVKGGETVEYSAHVIPEGGFDALNSLYGDGILVAGDAAGFALNIGVTVRGMEYAMASGYYAAETVLRAREKGDYSRATLSQYQRLLEDSFVLKDFRNFRDALSVLDNHRFFQYYPELLGNILKDLYQVPPGPKDRLYSTIRRYLGVREACKILGDVRRMRKI
ncbi:MAG TPA: FAD-dependent oxidoreductase [Syntrophothermus lipocalidus]|nr:FAD-dependent oxidoreductase [Syntrophothermus lipocalidus]